MVFVGVSRLIYVGSRRSVPTESSADSGARRTREAKGMADTGLRHLAWAIIALPISFIGAGVGVLSSPRSVLSKCGFCLWGACGVFVLGLIVVDGWGLFHG